MTLLASVTLADSQVRQNLASNLAAMDVTQPQLRPWVTEQHLSFEWVFGRDRTLTGLDEFGQWWSGCSLPKRAAEAMFAKLNPQGSVACFLNPGHCAQLRVALERMRPEQAIVAIVPDTRDLALMLHCDDFSREIASHRLWFAAGPAWDAVLQKLFEDQIGLAVPTQFIRTPDADEEQIASLIATAQQIFSRASQERTTITKELRQKKRPVSSRRLCVVAPSSFRLWNDPGAAMRDIFKKQSDVEITHFDADDPLCSSPLALLKAIQNCGAIFTANTARTDLPGVLPEALPWITWITSPRIPSSALAEAHDHLIVTDPALRESAVNNGWAKSNVHLGAWSNAHGAAVSSSERKHLSIVADTFSVETPKDLIEYSSHSLLWEAIVHELQNDPFVLRDANKFLDRQMTRLGVAADGFPRSRFIEKLILPAYQQGLARLLIRVKVPIQLHGQGWEKLTEFSSHAAGAISNRQQLAQAIEQSCAIIHVWPTNIAHPIDATGAAIIRPTSKDTFIRDAKRALTTKLPANSPPNEPLTLKLISAILDSTTPRSAATIGS